MRALVLLVPIVLLAGCTQFDEAKADLYEARAQLDEARADAQAAKDRYDRVRSATVIRNETLTVLVVPKSSERAFWFDTAAWRGVPGPEGTLIPPENLTSLPAIRLRTGGSDLVCDPLSCSGTITGADVNVTWADGAPGAFTLVGGNAECAPESAPDSYCAFPELRKIASIRVTTALADSTS